MHIYQDTWKNTASVRAPKVVSSCWPRWHRKSWIPWEIKHINDYLKPSSRCFPFWQNRWYLCKKKSGSCWNWKQHLVDTNCYTNSAFNIIPGAQGQQKYPAYRLFQFQRQPNHSKQKTAYTLPKVSRSIVIWFHSYTDWDLDVRYNQLMSIKLREFCWSSLPGQFPRARMDKLTRQQGWGSLSNLNVNVITSTYRFQTQNCLTEIVPPVFSRWNKHCLLQKNIDVSDNAPIWKIIYMQTGLKPVGHSLIT